MSFFEVLRREVSHTPEQYVIHLGPDNSDGVMVNQQGSSVKWVDKVFNTPDFLTDTFPQENKKKIQPLQTDIWERYD